MTNHFLFGILFLFPPILYLGVFQFLPGFIRPMCLCIGPLIFLILSTMYSFLFPLQGTLTSRYLHVYLSLEVTYSLSLSLSLSLTFSTLYLNENFQ